MSASDSVPIPRKGEAFRVYFPIFDETGSLVSGAAGLDSEISKDGAAFADCVSEATEVGQGMYYLDLTAAEMAADGVALIIKTTTPSAVTTPIVLYPAEGNDIVDPAPIADAVWDEALADHIAAGSTGAKLDDLTPSGGSGANEFIYTVTDSGSGNPIMGVRVWATTDAAGTNMVALAYTDAFGQVTFWLDSGTWYIWRNLSGYSFSNPDTEVIP